MKVVYNETLFPKFQDFGLEIPLLPQRFQNILSLVKERGWDSKEVSLDELSLPTDEELLLFHSKEYIDSLKEAGSPAILKCFEFIDEKGNLLYCRKLPEDESVARIYEYVLKQVEAVKFSAELALKEKAVYFLGGGMHHARKKYGHGFCLVNDVAYSISKIKEKIDQKKFLIIDVDAHLGDGNLDLLEGRDDVEIIDFYMKDAWPFNVEGYDLPKITELSRGFNLENQKDYLDKLKEVLGSLHSEELGFCFIIHGADAYEKDELSSSQTLKLSEKEILERDMMIENYLLDKDIPRLYVTAGGYGRFAHEVSNQFLEKVFE
ncbi:MAG: hypothetical protein ACPGJV_00785 [Bacteriovoracaceae bacterium]